MRNNIEIHRLQTLVKLANLSTVLVIVEICPKTQKTCEMTDYFS